MSQLVNRRKWLQCGAAGALASGLINTAALSMGQPASPAVLPTSKQNDQPSRLRFCLNTSTIREQKLDLAAEVELAAACGYDGIEPWIRELVVYEESGGKLEDLAKRIADLGLEVVNAIGFAPWIVDDDAQRAAGLEQAKRDMELVRRLGGSRIAAPPVGATSVEHFDLFKAADRYGALLRTGREIGVTPQLELWGFSKTLSRLGELALVAAECGEPDARVLPDVYHIYKGGSNFRGLQMIEADRIEVFHMNDYPAEPPRDKISDADRVYPGDGVAPLGAIFGELLSRGFAGTLSLELFNPTYWKQDAKKVATTGLAKMKASIAQAQAQAVPSH